MSQCGGPRARAISQKLSFSGLGRCDFPVHYDGATLLIEVSWPATQTCQFALRPGRDVCATLRGAVASVGFFELPLAPAPNREILLTPRNRLRDLEDFSRGPSRTKI